MPRRLKSAAGLSPGIGAEIADTVRVKLARLKSGGAKVARDCARRLDGWRGP